MITVVVVSGQLRTEKEGGLGRKPKRHLHPNRVRNATSLEKGERFGLRPRLFTLSTFLFVHAPSQKYCLPYLP